MISEEQRTESGGETAGSSGMETVRDFVLLVAAHLFHCVELYRPDRVLAGRDVFVNYYPIHWIYIDRLRHGELPFWNPYFNLGISYWADPVNGVLYPVYGLLFLFRNYLTAVSVLTALHFLLAELLFYGFLRSLKVSRLAAVAGAIIYMASGYLTMEATAHQFLYAHAWLPGLAWAVSRYLDGKPSGLFWASIVSAMFLLCGEPQTYVMAVPLAVFCIGWRKRCLKEGAKAGLALGVVPLLLWAPVLLPMLSFAAESARSHYASLEDALVWSLNPYRLLDMALPYLNGECISNISCWMKDGAGYSDTFYTGAATLPLIGAGLIAKDRRRQVVWWLTLSAAGILLALGGHLPFYGWLYKFLPGWKLFRYPERMLLYPTFGFAVVCAQALDGLRDIPRRLLFLLFGGALVLVLDVAAGSLHGLLLEQGSKELGFLAPLVIDRSCTWALVTLAASFLWVVTLPRLKPEHFLGLMLVTILIDVSGMTRNTFRTMPAEQIPRKPPAAAGLPPAGHAPPVHISDPRGVNLEIPNDWLHLFGPVIRKGVLLRGVYSVETLEGGMGATFGITSTLGPSAVSYPWRLYGYNGNLTLDAEAEFFGISLMTSHMTLAAKDKWRSDPGVPPDEFGFQMYRYEGRSDPVLCPPKYTHAASFDEILNTVRANPSVVYDQVIIAEPAPYLSAETADSHAASVCAVESWEPERVNIRVASESPGWMVYRRSYSKGWTAKVNGKAAKLYAAYGVFPALPLDAGDNRIELSYEPPYWKAGLAISILTLAGLLFWRNRLRRKGSDSD